MSTKFQKIKSAQLVPPWSDLAKVSTSFFSRCSGQKMKRWCTLHWHSSRIFRKSSQHFLLDLNKKFVSFGWVDQVKSDVLLLSKIPSFARAVSLHYCRTLGKLTDKAGQDITASAQGKRLVVNNCHLFLVIRTYSSVILIHLCHR